MAYPTMPGPQMAEPPEAQTARSMLKIARILALIFAIILLLIGIFDTVVLAVLFPAYIGFGVFNFIGFVVELVIYLQLKKIEALVNQHQYEQAKSKSLIWMILGFIFGYIIVGLFVLLAYLKFDPLITWQRNQMAGGAAPPPPGMAPPPAAAPAAAGAAAGAGAAPFCATCGKPTTYVAQYGRYYCYNCNKYV